MSFDSSQVSPVLNATIGASLGHKDSENRNEKARSFVSFIRFFYRFPIKYRGYGTARVRLLLKAKEVQLIETTRVSSLREQEKDEDLHQVKYNKNEWMLVIYVIE